MINSSFYFIRNPIFSVAENRDFGRFVTTWYSVHCKHTRFFEFLGLLNEFFLEEAWFWGVRVGFGGREGALASALIGIYRYRHFFTHFAALSVTDTKQMVTIWTSRFEDLSLNCVLG